MEPLGLKATDKILIQLCRIIILFPINKLTKFPVTKNFKQPIPTDEFKSRSKSEQKV